MSSAGRRKERRRFSRREAGEIRGLRGSPPTIGRRRGGTEVLKTREGMGIKAGNF